MIDTKELIDLLKESRDALDCSEPYRPQLNGRLQAAIAELESEPERKPIVLAELVREIVREEIEILKDQIERGLGVRP